MNSIFFYVVKIVEISMTKSFCVGVTNWPTYGTTFTKIQWTGSSLFEKFCIYVDISTHDRHKNTLAVRELEISGIATMEKVEPGTQ